jgi:hypothetical protein
MSWLSSLGHFVYDRVLASAARSSSSVNPTATSIGAAATAAVMPIISSGLKDVAAGIDDHKSPLGIANVVIGDAETGIKIALDALIGRTVGAIPLVGGVASQEAVTLANAFLDTQRDHFLTYVAAHFGHASAVVNAPPATSTQQL